MKISENGIKFIANWEGKRNSQYPDAVGLPTIGIGHLIKKGEVFPKVMTDQQVYDLFRKDIVGYENAVNKSVKVAINQNQFDALVSLAFNIGIGGFQSSSVLRNLNAKNFTEASNSFLKWNKGTVNGKLIEILGLTNRRKTERDLFNKK